MTTLTPATERQVDYLRSLLASRKVDADYRADLESRLADGILDKGRASDAISALRVAPKAAAPSKPNVEEGMYRKGGVIFRVHRSRESGNLYAKRLELDLMGSGKPSFVYAKGAIMSITTDDKMSRDDAKAFGVETGICCVCSAYLTDAKSVAEGIGPVCAKRF